MQFTLTIALGNEAMRTDGDIADALRQVAVLFAGNDFEDITPEDGPIRDVNGNTVGSWIVE